MKRIVLPLLVTALLFGAASQSRATTMYGGVGSGSPLNPGGLLIVDQNNGAGLLVGDPVTPGGLSGIAFDSGGALFGSTIERGSKARWPGSIPTQAR